MLFLDFWGISVKTAKLDNISCFKRKSSTIGMTKVKWSLARKVTMVGSKSLKNDLPIRVKGNAEKDFLW